MTDRLSHVLVAEAFESQKDFFYPLPNRDYKGDVVTLADVPFVPLRHELPKHLLKDKASYSEIIRIARLRLGPALLEFDFATRRVKASGEIIPMQRANLAFYAWLARRTRQGLKPLPRPKGEPNKHYAAEFLAEYIALSGNDLDEDHDTLKTLRHGMDEKYFDERKSNVNSHLREVLGTGTKYEIKTVGKRPRTGSGLELAPEQIFFTGGKV
ncbi:CRISPR-associated ring nuclease [Methylomagnum sp.]